MSNSIPSSSSTSAETAIAGIADMVSTEDAAAIAVTGAGIGNRRGRGSVCSANDSKIASMLITTPTKKQKTTALTSESPLPLSDVSNNNEGGYSDAASPAAAAAAAADAAEDEEGENPMECITSSSSSSNNDEDSNADDDYYYSTNVLGDDDKIIPERDGDDAEVETPASYATTKELKDADIAMLSAVSKFTNTQVCTAPRDTVFELPPLSKEEEEWFNDCPDHLRKRWDELPRAVRKVLKGPLHRNPPKLYIVTTIVENEDGTTSEICVATATSHWGRGEYVRSIPGRDGERQKKCYVGTRGKGDMDPKCLVYQIGGAPGVTNLKPGDKSVEHRGLKITCVLGEESERFIKATEQAEKNKDLFESLMEKIEEDRKKNNGRPIGETVPMYLIEPAEDCKNNDKTLPDTRAKAKRFTCLQKAIGYRWDEKTSDMIRRLKKNKFGNVRHEDLSPFPFKLNGYMLTLIESEEVFESLVVSVVYDEDTNNWDKLPDALPKRVRADQPDNARKPGFYFAIYGERTDAERGIEPKATGYGTGAHFTDNDPGLFPALNRHTAEKDVRNTKSTKYQLHWKKGSAADDKVIKKAISVSKWKQLSDDGWLYNVKAKLWVHGIVHTD
ncbi:hypothetical protein ACHAWC_003935 [Mediolabrus comicus]